MVGAAAQRRCAGAHLSDEPLDFGTPPLSPS
jgi:hypothetical protein